MPRTEPHSTEVRFPTEGGSRSVQAKASLEIVFHQVFLRVLEGLLEPGFFGADKRSTLEQLVQEHEHQLCEVSLVLSSPTATRLPHPVTARERVQNFEEKLTNQLQLTPTEIQPLDIEGRVRLEFCRLMSTHSFYTIRRQINSSLVPADHRSIRVVPLNYEFDREFPCSAQFRQYGFSGCSAATRRFPHDSVHQPGRLVNAWFTDYQIGNGMTLMEMFRGGSLCPSWLLSQMEQQELSTQMFEEFLCAVALRYLAKLPSERKARYIESSEPLKLKLVSVDLQNWWGKHRLKGEVPRSNLEVKTQGDLFRIQGCGEKEIAVLLANSDFSVRLVRLKLDLESAAFNFACDAKAFLNAEHLWDREITDHNQRAFEALLLWGAQSGDGERATEAESAVKLTHLGNEIREIWSNELYKSAGMDPFKISSRLVNYAYLCGAQVFGNCMAGKDRTALMVAESFLLAEQLHAFTTGATDQLPSFRRRLVPEERTMLGKLCTKGGSLEVQQLQSGAPGYAYLPVKALNDRRVTAEACQDDPLYGRFPISDALEIRGLADCGVS